MYPREVAPVQYQLVVRFGELDIDDWQFHGAGADTKWPNDQRRVSCLSVDDHVPAKQALDGIVIDFNPSAFSNPQIP
jgi:hypothetical protein